MLAASLRCSIRIDDHRHFDAREFAPLIARRRGEASPTGTRFFRQTSNDAGKDLGSDAGRDRKIFLNENVQRTGALTQGSE
jgi:hypothetical protein